MLYIDRCMRFTTQLAYASRDEEDVSPAPPPPPPPIAAPSSPDQPGSHMPLVPQPNDPLADIKVARFGDQLTRV